MAVVTTPDFETEIVGNDRQGWSIDVVLSNGERVHLVGLYRTQRSAEDASSLAARQWAEAESVQTAQLAAS